MEVTRLTSIVAKLKSQEPYFAYYRLWKYEDLKVENILFDLRH